MGKLSKLIICIVMVGRRHRGLPVALDRTIAFPTEIVHKRVDKIMLKRSVTSAAVAVEMTVPTAASAVEQVEEKLPAVNEDSIL
jgi:hypothetical protein